VFHKSGSLKIAAYLYRPTSEGPFPLIIHNHGSRDGQERPEQPAPFIARVLTPVGYAVLVPERRGYGKSLDYAKGVPDIDMHRIGIMGRSFGGIGSRCSAWAPRTMPPRTPSRAFAKTPARTAPARRADQRKTAPGSWETPDAIQRIGPLT
jgi:dienelactone hydrolase